MTPKSIPRNLPALPILLAAFAILFAALPHTAFAQSGRLHVVAHVDVLPTHAKDTIALLQDYAADSRKDAGVLRIDVLREAGRPNHFTLIELWESKAAYDAHIARDRTKAFREKLYPWLGSPYDERLNEEVK